MNSITTQIERAAQAARSFRSRGYNALPSRADRKGPALASYAEYWETPLPDPVYDRWEAPNLQVMMGARWRLCVVDCDSERAKHLWWEILEEHRSPIPDRTWIAATGGGGRHYYYALPPGIDECPSGRLWGLWDTYAGATHEGGWLKHQEIRLLADRALAIAPPSVHVQTGRPYVWIPGASPDDFDRPGLAPDWLLALPRLATPMPARPAWVPQTPPPVKSPIRLAGASASRVAVLDAIPDKIALAASWGLSFASQSPNAAGWCKVYALGRPDRNPSAAFHAGSGSYTDFGDGIRLSLFDLGVQLGHYASWGDCKDDLQARYLAPGRPGTGTGARTPAPAYAN